MDHCDEWIKLSEKLFPGRSYPRILVDFEKINAAVSVMYEMKQTFQPTAEVNSFISDINKMGIEPLNVRNRIHIGSKLINNPFQYFSLQRRRKTKALAMLSNKYLWLR